MKSEKEIKKVIEKLNYLGKHILDMTPKEFKEYEEDEKRGLTIYKKSNDYLNEVFKTKEFDDFFDYDSNYMTNAAFLLEKSLEGEPRYSIKDLLKLLDSSEHEKWYKKNYENLELNEDEYLKIESFLWFLDEIRKEKPEKVKRILED